MKPTPDVKLDCIRKKDSEKLLHWRNSESIYKWCRQVDLLTELGHEKWLESHQLDKTVKMYSIANANRELIGVCGLTDIDLLNQRAEFSLYIGPEFQRQGYAKEALRQLLAHAFKCYPFKVIWGETFQGNPALELFYNLGFKFEGTRRNFYFKDGKHINANLISITREEFYVAQNINHNFVGASSGVSIIPAVRFNTTFISERNPITYSEQNQSSAVG